ncbi:MAG: hypothetical protein LBU34_12665 [Planctomycetaceae bacterium]|nr:hypothetical protein [Planctomycetaceae bacterium]
MTNNQSVKVSIRSGRQPFAKRLRGRQPTTNLYHVGYFDCLSASDLPAVKRSETAGSDGHLLTKSTLLSHYLIFYLFNEVIRLLWCGQCCY